MSNTYEDMYARCVEFNREHPEVWRMFVEFTRDRIERGFDHYSARAIFHRIRWETEYPGSTEGEEYQLNDHHSPFYARAFMNTFPEHRGFFRVRVQTSRAVAA
jgi:hypothetical protein